MSRLGAIQTAVAAHVTTAFTNASETVTIKSDPDAFDNIKKEEFPAAIIIFVEEDPERLAFKQQRRRVNGVVAIAMSGETLTREIVDLRIEAIRDLIFADSRLGFTVTAITAEAGVTVSNPDDDIIYGELEITTEELF